MTENIIKTGLSEQTEARINNVVVFISDSLRYDYLPDQVAKKGITAEAIAPSTFTGSSLPSITSGQNPSTHGVWMFDDMLPQVPDVFRVDGYDTGFDARSIWIKLPSDKKPPLRINRLTQERKIDDLDTPFIHFVHDIGPHAPYGFENGVFESTKEFFQKEEKRQIELINLYSQNCQTSASKFIDIYKYLKKNEVLDETLLIFTSDHGEALGEQSNGGRFGHGHPMSPETVRVPIVFCGGGLPKGKKYDSLLSSTDIVPTVFSAIGKSDRTLRDGEEIWETPPSEDRLLQSEVWQHLNVAVLGRDKDVSVYSACSAWDQSGGYVFHQKSTIERIGSIAYDNLFRGYSPAWKANLTLSKAIQMTKWALGSDFVFGNPDFSKQEARNALPNNLTDVKRETQETLSRDQKEHLKDMGYL